MIHAALWIASAVFLLYVVVIVGALILAAIKWTFTKVSEGMGPVGCIIVLLCMGSAVWTLFLVLR